MLQILVLMELIDHKVEDFHKKMLLEMLLVNNNNPNQLMKNLNEYNYLHVLKHIFPNL